MSEDLANELATEAIDVVFTVFWAETFDESQLRKDIAQLFQRHLATATPLEEPAPAGMFLYE